MSSAKKDPIGSRLISFFVKLICVLYMHNRHSYAEITIFYGYKWRSYGTYHRASVAEDDGWIFDIETKIFFHVELTKHCSNFATEKLIDDEVSNVQWTV